MLWRKDKFEHTLLKEFWSLLHQISNGKDLVLKGRHIDSIVLAIVNAFKELKYLQVK